MSWKKNGTRNLTGLVLGGALAMSSRAKADIVGYWDFNEGQDAIAHDSSGFHNDGTLASVFWSRNTPSGNGYSTEFRQEWNPAIWVSNDTSLNLDDQFVFEARIRMSGQWNQPIIARWSANGDPNAQHHPYLFGARLTGDGREVRPYIKIEGENDAGVGREFSLFGETSLQNNEWYDLAASYDGENLRVFVNGVLDSESLIERINISDTTGALGIGRSGYLGMSEPFVHGWIDDVKMSNHYYDVPCPSTIILGGLGASFQRRVRNKGLCK